MGFFDMFTGRTKALEFKLLFDTDDKVSINITPYTSPIRNEYFFLFGLYFSKIFYNLGGFTSQGAMIAVNAVNNIIVSGISSQTNCFKEADCDDVIQYAQVPTSVVNQISGSISVSKDGNRTIWLNLPSNTTEQHLVFGLIALMQFVINENIDNQNNLTSFSLMCKSMVTAYENGAGTDMRDIIIIPMAAYYEAFI